MFSPQHHQRWLQPRAEQYLPRAAGCQLPLAARPHAGAISTSSSPAEKPIHFTGQEKSQALEQWQKCLQPASFQARRPFGIKQKSTRCWLTTDKPGARSGCQAEGLEAALVRVVGGCAGTALRRATGIQLPCSSCSCSHPGVQELAQPHEYLLFIRAERLQDQRRHPLRSPASRRALRPGLWLLLLQCLLPASLLDVSS